MIKKLRRAILPTDLLICAGLFVWVAAHIVSETYFVELDPTAPASIRTMLVRLPKVTSFLLMILGKAFKRRRVDETDVAWLCALALLYALGKYLGSTALFQAALIVCLSSEIDLEEIYTVQAWGILAPLIAIIALAAVGIVPEGNGLEATASRVARSSFGFAWPSRVPNMVLAAIMAFALARKGKFDNLTFGALALTTVVVFFATNSRNPFLLTVMLLVMLFVFPTRTRSVTTRRFLRVFALSFCWCFLVIFVLTAFYSPKFELMRFFNRILSNRLLYAHAAFDTTGIALFGSPAYFGDQLVAGEGFIDSGYLRLLFSYGPIMCFLYIGLLTMGAWKKAEQGDVVFVICVFIIAIHAIAETQIIDIVYTPILYFAREALRFHGQKTIRVGKRAVQSDERSIVPWRR
jgi:hypothetical protein